MQNESVVRRLPFKNLRQKYASLHSVFNNKNSGIIQENHERSQCMRWVVKNKIVGYLQPKCNSLNYCCNVMFLLTDIIMGKHEEWRKVAKRERRRRIRTLHAKDKDSTLNHTADDYQRWLKEQEALELFLNEQIEKTNMEEHEKWMQAEKTAVTRWQQLQDKKERLRQKRLEQNAKLQMEWELEQERLKKEEERLQEIKEENKKRQQIFMETLQNFLSGDSVEPPPELMTSRETKPNSEPCPFFSKTACCRFGDQCSRNHRYPGISKVLLATNFYCHFGLDNANFNEYDTDVMLEYEDNDTYREFEEFFNDVLPEFEKFGRVIQFKVCNNYEKHLRGNTYIEFAELRCAVAAYQSLHTRWYGGKQLSLQFCLINSWKNAICGLQSRKRCPKGRACNFLHVFRNPNNLFNSYNNERNQDYERSRRTPPRSWRWSESPEVEIPKRKRSKSRERSRRGDRERREDSRRYKDSSRHSHRSHRRSSERRKK